MPPPNLNCRINTTTNPASPPSSLLPKFKSSPRLQIRPALMGGQVARCTAKSNQIIEPMTTACSNSKPTEQEWVVRDFGQLANLQPKDQFTAFLANAKGKDIFGRYTPALNYIEQVQKDGLGIDKRGLQSAPSTTTTVSDLSSTNYFGENFASNNYLGLAQHPSTVEAAIDAASTFGVNSAGSPLAFGATKYFMQLKEEIGEFWSCKTLIYSSGWLSGFGTIKSLTKEDDYVIIDEFADNSFFEGAHAATKNVFKNRHLDEAHVLELLKQIRAKDTENGIMIVTEGIFPVDSGSPNLVNLQKMAKEYKAFVTIGCGHDFGVAGKGGRGVWQQQGLSDRSNIILVGTGSKTTSINFGFIGCIHPHVPEYMKYFSAAYMFTNAINPVQANSALATLRVIRSQEGALLRKDLLENCNYLREKLQAKGYSPLGRASGFVCVRVGDEIVSRIIVRVLMDNEIHVNNVEYPLAPLGGAVVRFSLTPQHTRSQMDKLVSAFDFSVKRAKGVRGQQRQPSAKL